jgi:hypothetical protein
MAFSAEKKDLVIDGFELKLRHEDGDTRTLRWAGLAETFSEITDNAGNRQVVGRDQVPIAMKVGTESLIEKFVRFQEPRYHETDRPAISSLIAHFNFLKRTSPGDYVPRTISSKEFFSLVDTRQKSFWWKPGRYQITLSLTSPRRFKLMRSSFYFDLTTVDIDRLKENLSVLESELRNGISSNLPAFKAEPINWNWANVDVHKANIAEHGENPRHF